VALAAGATRDVGAAGAGELTVSVCVYSRESPWWSRTVPQWLEDYNEVAPHSALGMKSPRDYRAEQTLSASL
jgi:hypothetical protein